MNQKFHAHIYFNQWQRSTAEAIYLAIATMITPKVQLGKFHLQTVGPHSSPMFTVMFDSSEKIEFTQFLLRNQKELSILIHEDTGNDYRDHTHGAEWLGKPLPINFEHFERIKNEKSALIFPES